MTKTKQTNKAKPKQYNNKTDFVNYKNRRSVGKCTHLYDKTQGEKQKQNNFFQAHFLKQLVFLKEKENKNKNYNHM